MQGVPVQFTFLSGPVQNIGTVLTAADGSASIRPNLTNRSGTVTVRAEATNLEPVLFTLTVQ